MVKEIDTQITEKVINKPRGKESRAPACTFAHEWNFEQDGKTQEQLDGELRQAIRHMVIFRHQANGSEYGGYEPDSTLARKLNLVWFQKVGLLKPVALRFRGDINEVLKFALPEALQSQLPDSTTIEFWQELKRDLEAIEEKVYKVPLARFLRYFNPEKNKSAWLMRTGKYQTLWLDFASKANDGSGPRLDEFLTYGFTPPENNLEFAKLVRETRQLIFEKLYIPKKAPASERLSNPKFWPEFAKDLASLDRHGPFSQIIQYFNPDARNGWSTVGKYQSIYHYLYLASQSKEDETQKSTKFPGSRISRAFFDLAPQDIKLLLISKFPKDFGRYAKEILKGQEFLTPQLQSLLELISSLNPASQDQILSPLANYILAKQPNITRVEIKADDLKKVLTEVVRQQAPSAQNIIGNLDFVSELLEEAKTKDQPDLATCAKELVEILNKVYYSTVIKSILYKPAAMIWSMYHDQNPHSQTVPPEILVSFLEKHFQEKVIADLNGPNQQMAEYLKSQVLPEVLQYFAEIASFAPQIRHFRKTDEVGNSKHLFFHQVEGIKDLIKNKGGIVADEPGTGKTLILTLAGLNLPEHSGLRDQIRRILVVGTKSVIDNWEGELAQHLELGNIAVINANFTQEKKNTQWKHQLRPRLQQLEKLLQFPEHANQIILVNYDLFRNPVFKRIIRNYSFESVIIDEAHNVKSRFLGSIDLANGEASAQIAKRTQGLYEYVKGLNQQGGAVFWASSTPFVKELVEPLIMAHLTKPALVPLEEVRQLMGDVVGTHQLLREIMIRRRKEEITDLPPKETVHIPIDLQSLSEEEKAEFTAVAQELTERTENSFARFYSLLSLEGLAKYPWLISKVGEILADGRKVVIFTPFVAGEDKYTAPISTKRIAEKLRQAGIDSVGILDGSLDESERLAIQEDFRKKDGVKILVGNYLTAGESITLNSSQNRATEVILFIAPNSISRYIQAIDRIHRYGQEEKVTIHIPYVTGDLLDRDGGTYDERVVRRLVEELTKFGAVIDGLFFMEPADIYQTIVQAEIAKIKGSVEFKVDLERKETIRRRSPSLPRLSLKEFDDELLEDELAERSMLDDRSTVDFGWTRTLNTADLEDQSLADLYFEEVKRYPLLTSEQEQILFDYLSKDLQVGDLKTDERFLATIEPENQEDFANLIRDNQSIKDLIANCNLLLVASIAQKYRGRGLEFLDLIQEGSIGLMTAIEKFDPGLGYKLSTYATWWIRQAVTHAIADKSRNIRLPAHMHEEIIKARGISARFEAENGRSPNVAELRELLISKSNFSETRANSVIKTIQSGILQTVSLDKEVGDDDSVLADFVADRKMNTQDQAIETTEDEELKIEVERALKNLSPKEEQALRFRFGLDDGQERTLEEAGREMNLTRERIRQLEGKGLAKLRRDKELYKSWWEKDAPSFLYKRISAEDAAIRLGLFNNPVAFAQRVFSQLPEALQTIFQARAVDQQSKEAVVFKTGSSPQKIDDDFNLARIKIWEGLAKLPKESLLDPDLRRDIYGKYGSGFRQYIDLITISRLFEIGKEDLGPLERQVFGHFFGFEDGQTATLNSEAVAQKLNVGANEVITSVKRGLTVLENATQKAQQQAKANRIKEAIEQIMQNQEVWQQIPERERAILKFLENDLTRKSDQRIVKENLAKIFKVSVPQLDRIITASLAKAARSLKPGDEKTIRPSKRMFYDQVVQLRNQGLSRKEIARKLNRSVYNVGDAIKYLIKNTEITPASKDGRKGQTERTKEFDTQVQILVDQGLKNSQIAQRLGKPKQIIQRSVIRLSKGNQIPTDMQRLDHSVEELIKEKPHLVNKQIAAEISQKVGQPVARITISRSKTRLVATGKIGPYTFSPEQWQTLKSQVEDLFKQNMTYAQIAQRLQQHLSRVKVAGQMLRSEGRIQSRTSLNKKVLAVLKDQIEEHPEQSINLSEIARKTESSRERVRQVYRNLEKQQPVPPLRRAKTIKVQDGANSKGQLSTGVAKEKVTSTHKQNEFDAIVETIIKEKPQRSNSEIAAETSRRFRPVSLGTVKVAKSRLIEAGKLNSRSDSARILDSQVANLIIQNPNITNGEIVEKLGVSKEQVEYAAQRLRRAKRVSSRVHLSSSNGHDKGARAILETHLAAHPNQEINISEIAREAGVSTTRIRYLYRRAKALPVKK